jgi:hypothetical protein
MAHRSIEEVIQTIAPSRREGIPNPPTIGIGVSSDNGDLAASLSQAGQQIAQLQSVYQQQANLIAENTQALQSNTSAKSGAGGSAVGGVASSLFGGALSFLSPIISGIASLFGGSSTPQPLPIYTPPPPVSISGAVQSAPAAQTSNPAASGNSVSTSLSTSGTSSPSREAVRVNTGDVNAATRTNEPEGRLGGAGALLSPILASITNLFGAGPGAQALPVYSPVAASDVSENTPARSGLPANTDGNNTVSSFPQPQNASLAGNSAIGNIFRLFAGSSSTIVSCSADASAGGSPGALPQSTEGLPSSIISALTDLLGGGQTRQEIPGYTIPPISGMVPPTPVPTQSADAGVAGSPQATATSPTNCSPQITVNVSAMDSQSFMDRSNDIANAVRAAMLNMHPINDVVAEL